MQIGVGVARSGEIIDEILYYAALTKKLKDDAAVESSATKFYRFDGFIVDVQSACLRRNENPVPLRPKSFAVLLYLVQNPGRLVQKNELIDNVWSNVTVTDNSLVQCVKEVREALGDDLQKIIKTVAKRGYVFAPTVVEIDAPEDKPSVSTGSPSSVGSLASKVAPHIVQNQVRPQSPMAITFAATAALAIGAGLWWMSSRSDTWQLASATSPLQSDRARDLSVAVLPFSTSNSSASDDAYFSTGISEDISSALGRFSDLTVASPKGASRFRSVGASAEDIARQLKVRYLVEGSVGRSPQRIRIAVRLTDLPRGVLIWSDAFDAPAATILAIEEEITARIAGALAVRLTNLEQRRAANKSVSSMDAYELVLRARELMTRLNRTSHSQARAMFERAIALEPRTPAAYVGLGRVDLSAVALGWTPDAGEALRRAEGLARQAISLDEFNPAAHVLLGRTYARMGEYERAVDALRRAITLNPSDPDSHSGLGDALLWSGEVASAIKALETAVSIDPALSGEDLFSLGAAYFLGGRLPDAVRILERVTTRNEGNPFIYAMLAAAYAEAGREQEAKSAAAEVRKRNPFFHVEGFGSLFNNPSHRDMLARALKKSGL